MIAAHRGFIKASPRANRAKMVNAYISWLRSNGHVAMSPSILAFVGDGTWTIVLNVDFAEGPMERGK